MAGDVALTDLLDRVDALADLDDAERARLLPHLAVLEVPRTAALVRQGDAATGLIWVVDGTAAVVVSTDGGAGRRTLARIGPGSVVGEIGALVRHERSATVRALEPVLAVTCDAAGLATLVELRPERGRELLDLARRRLHDTELRAVLATLFHDLSPRALEELAAIATWLHVPAGERVFVEGDAGDAAHVVITGRLRVERTDAYGHQSREGVVSRGEFVGAMAVLTQVPRRVTVTATRDTVLASFARDDFARLVEKRPKALLTVTRAVLDRPTGGGRRGRARGVVGIVPVAGADVAPLAGGLAHALERHGTVGVLSREVIDGLLGEEGACDAEGDSADGLRLDQLLHEHEVAHTTSVLVADGEDSPWRRRVLARCDEVLVVARGDQPAPEGPLLADTPVTSPHGPTSTLVLVHARTLVAPSGTAAWLEAVAADGVLHVRRGQASDLARLARHVTGRTVCVVLSGGAARGLAHVGALGALERAGVPIDAFGAASIGATIATAWSLLRAEDEVTAAGRVAFKDVVDWTLPVTSLAAGKRLTSNIVGVFGDMDMEDLWLPVVVSSTNLTQSRAEYHDRGSVVQAVRASVSIPGVFPPVAIDGDQHIDGGVLDNMPLREMRRRYPRGTIIGIDVAPPRGPSARGDWGSDVSGWRQAAGKVVPGRRKGSGAPGIASTILSATLVAATVARDAAVADRVPDAYFHLGIRGIGLLEFDDVVGIAAAGRESMEPQIRQWLTIHQPTW